MIKSTLHIVYMESFRWAFLFQTFGSLINNDGPHKDASCSSVSRWVCLRLWFRFLQRSGGYEVIVLGYCDSGITIFY